MKQLLYDSGDEANLFVSGDASCSILNEERRIPWSNRPSRVFGTKDKLGNGEVVRNVGKGNSRAKFSHGKSALGRNLQGSREV